MNNLYEQLEQQELWVGIPNEMVDNEEVSNEAIAMYYFIGETLTNKGYSVTSIGWLVGELLLTQPDKYYCLYRKAIKQLEHLGYISVFGADGEKIDILQVKKNDRLYICLSADKEYFKANVCDVKDIMKYAQKQKIKARCGFLRYYLMIQRWTNFEDGHRVGHLSGKKAKLCVTDARTIKQFNEILNELHIFHYNNSYRTPELNRNVATHFARKSKVSREKFEMILAEKAKAFNWVYYNKESTNKRISDSLTKHYQQQSEKVVPEPCMVLVKGFEDEVQVDLVAILKAGVITELQYQNYINEYNAKGFIVDLEDLLIIGMKNIGGGVNAQ